MLGTLSKLKGNPNNPELRKVHDNFGTFEILPTKGKCFVMFTEPLPCSVPHTAFRAIITTQIVEEPVYDTNGNLTFRTENSTYFLELHDERERVKAEDRGDSTPTLTCR